MMTSDKELEMLQRERDALEYVVNIYSKKRNGNEEVVAELRKECYRAWKKQKTVHDWIQDMGLPIQKDAIGDYEKTMEKKKSVKKAPECKTCGDE